ASLRADSVHTSRSRRARAARAPPPLPTRRSSDLRQRCAVEELAPARVGHRLDRVHLVFVHDFVAPVFRCGQSHPIVTALSGAPRDRKSTRLNSSHVKISYAVFCLKKKSEPLRVDG